MILAAGRGQRMRPLTDNTPKPMLRVGGKALIEWHINALVSAGFQNLIINHAWLGHVIEQGLGDGQQYGATIQYSPESVALETAGGIAKALPLLGENPFPVLNGDVFTDWPMSQLAEVLNDWQDGQLAYLVLVPNPKHHPEGDFALVSDTGLVITDGPKKFTFSGIGVYHPDLFRSVEPGQPFKLAPLLRDAMDLGQVKGELYTGRWEDVGTPERLELLNHELSDQDFEGIQK